MSTTVQMRQKGQFTIPADMRDVLGIKENEAISVSLIGKEAILLIPQKLKTAELLKATSEAAAKRGITLEEMLAELDEIRHQA